MQIKMGTVFGVGDIQVLRPEWSDIMCETFLLENRRRFEGLLASDGWSILEVMVSEHDLELNKMRST